MSKEIKKSIRFSREEWTIIEQKLNENKMSFSSFVKKALLKKKIISTYNIEVLNELNSISLALSDIADNINRCDLVLIIYHLVKIERKMEKVLCFIKS